ncbi:hypothetical protein CV102_22550 [Natronococcus pandeyae]|uniref:Glycosyltransferase n=1 Tax=Natronococcus pandeyae TaxID=2055836 RepID=A0A8J8Q0Y9_9EURY|nr:glycosyltransferase family 4 protein [Natronococcus pandeyae]TYL36408.1 hypothetical protein CV102_22550 [Natronococcus pandeyae]
MNVLQVTPADVYPPTNGSDHRTHAMVTAFPEHGDTVYRFCQVRQFSTFRKGDLRRRVPVDEHYVEYRALNPFYELVRAAASVAPGRSSLEFTGTCLCTWSTARLRKLLNWCDVVIVRGSWQVPAITALTDEVLVLYSVHGTRPPDNEAEQRALDDADAVLFESEWSVQEYERRFDVRTPHIVAPVATYDSNVRDSFANPERRARIRCELGADETTVVGLFVGTVHPLNVEAAEWLLEMAAAARDRGENIHVAIAGSVGSELDASPPNASVLGFVDDLEPYFDAADIGLNPATVSEGGPNIKMLDYFARGLPVVSTERGVRGLEVSHGEEVVVAPRKRFLNELVDLAEDDDRRKAMGESARRFVEENHTWSAVSRGLRADIRELRSEVSRSRPVRSAE